MEKLNPIWFLESPLDIEHKSYVLLDFLKNKSQNLDGPSVLSSLKEISTLVKAMNSFKERRKIPESLLAGSSKEALSEYNKITGLPRENEVLKLVSYYSFFLILIGLFLFAIYSYKARTISIFRNPKSSISEIFFYFEINLNFVFRNCFFHFEIKIFIKI
jgi:hypothetical protein